MLDRDVVNLIVVDLSVTMRQYVSESDDIAGMRNLFRDSRSDRRSPRRALPQRETACHPRLKFHEHIDIAALGIKIAAQNRSEYFESAHAMNAAQSTDLVEIVFDQRGHDCHAAAELRGQYSTQSPRKVSCLSGSGA
jgi:hypothetical protein